MKKATLNHSGLRESATQVFALAQPLGDKLQESGVFAYGDFFR